MQNRFNPLYRSFALFAGVTVVSVGMTGCERKERVVDVEAPESASRSTAIRIRERSM
jgi:hypothetical protein